MDKLTGPVFLAGKVWGIGPSSRFQLTFHSERMECIWANADTSAKPG
jgi:hypothetical protein